jgi:hypothetical protein
MRIKKYPFILLLVTAFSLLQSTPAAAQSKKAQSTIHEMLIFKWCKDGETNIKRYIKIDSLGNVIIKGQNILEKVDMKLFTKEIHNFIKGGKLEKIPGDDNPPRMAAIPEKDKQNIYISIVLTEDYINDKALANKTYYSWIKLGLDKLENDYALFNYLDPKEVAMLKRYLE